MNYQYGSTANAEGKKVIRSYAALALAVGLALAFPGSLIARDGEPIPGVDVNLGKNPGGSRIVPIDALGKFSLRLTERGQYTVSTACRQQSCPPHALSINVSGVPLKPGADGSTSYEFTVGDRPVVLGGQLESTASVWKAPAGVESRTPSKSGDVKAISEHTLADGRTAALPKDGAATFKSSDNDSPLPTDRVTSPRAPTSAFKISEDNNPLPTDRVYAIAIDPSDPSASVPSKVGDPIPKSESGIASGTAIPQVNVVVFLNTSLTSRGIATTTDANGAFKFINVRPGKYELTIAGQTPAPVTVGPDGKISGEVMSGGAGDGSGTRVYRITNVRVNADALGVAGSVGGANTVPGKGVDNSDRLRNSVDPGTFVSPGIPAGIGAGVGAGPSPVAGPMGR